MVQYLHFRILEFPLSSPVNTETAGVDGYIPLEKMVRSGITDSDITSFPCKKGILFLLFLILARSFR